MDPIFRAAALNGANIWGSKARIPEGPPRSQKRSKMSDSSKPSHDVAPAGYDKIISGLEDATWKALQKSGSELLPFLSPDCVMMFPLGLKVSHQSEPNIEDILTSGAFIPWEKYRMEDVEVVPLGASAAVITYKARATRPEAAEFRALISSVWRRVPNGNWELCVHQQTPYDQEVGEMAQMGE